MSLTGIFFAEMFVLWLVLGVVVISLVWRAYFDQICWNKVGGEGLFLRFCKNKGIWAVFGAYFDVSRRGRGSVSPAVWEGCRLECAEVEAEGEGGVDFEGVGDFVEGVVVFYDGFVDFSVVGVEFGTAFELHA